MGFFTKPRPAPTPIPDKPEVTRVTVIDHRAVPVRVCQSRGLLLEIRDVKVSTVLQDEGRTLKVFINDDFETEAKRAAGNLS